MSSTVGVARDVERCHACDTAIEGEPPARGLLMWPRGDDFEYEEPALCASCARAIGLTVIFHFEREEEEG